MPTYTVTKAVRHTQTVEADGVREVAEEAYAVCEDDYVMLFCDTQAEAEQYITDLRWKEALGLRAAEAIEPMVDEYSRRYSVSGREAWRSVMELMDGV